MTTAVPDQTWSHVWRTWTVLQCEMRQENQYLHEDTANLLNRHTTGLSLELTMNKPAHLLQCRPLVKCRQYTTTRETVHFSTTTEHHS